MFTKFKPGQDNKVHDSVKEVDPGCVSGLLSIALEGDLNKIRQYIADNKVSCNSTNEDGDNVIHLILNNSFSDQDESQKLKLIKFFVNQGASVNMQNKQNITPLHLAAKNQYPTIVEYILKQPGIDPNILDMSNMNALHYAVQSGVVTCKDNTSNKATDIIPGPSKSRSDEYYQQVLKQLASNIVTLLDKDPTLKKLNIHIKTLLSKLDHMYPLEVDTLKDKLEKTDPSVKAQVSQTLVDDLNKYVNGKLNTTLSKEDISKDDSTFVPIKLDDVLKQITEEYENLEKEKEVLVTELTKLNSQKIKLTGVDTTLASNKGEIPTKTTLINNYNLDLTTYDSYIQHINGQLQIKTNNNINPTYRDYILNNPNPAKLVDIINKRDPNTIISIDGMVSVYLKELQKYNIEYNRSLYLKKITDMLTDIYTLFNNPNIDVFNQNDEEYVQTKIDMFFDETEEILRNLQLSNLNIQNISEELEILKTIIYDYDNLDKKHLKRFEETITKNIKIQQNIITQQQRELNTAKNNALLLIQKFKENKNDINQEIRKLENEVNKLNMSVEKLEDTELDRRSKDESLDTTIKEQTESINEIEDKLDNLYKRGLRLQDLNTRSQNNTFDNFEPSEETKRNDDGVVEPLEESINGSILDTHLKMLKQNIIKLVGEIYKKDTELNKYSPKFKQNRDELIKINKDVSKVTGQLSNTNYDIYKMTDGLVTNIIKDYIFSGSINAVKKIGGEISNGDTAEKLLENKYKVTDQTLISRNDDSFTLDLGEIINNIIEKFKKRPDIKDYTQLQYTSKLIKEDEQVINTQQEVYDDDYTNIQEVTDKKCYSIKPETIINLLTSCINVNQKDTKLNTPLYYAINLVYPNIVELLAKNNAIINDNTFKNNTGVTPLMHAINLFIEHSEGLTQNADRHKLTNLYNYVHKSIEDGIKSNEKFANNIILYLNNIFPQLILMYNHTFSLAMNNYRNGWTVQEQDNLNNFINNQDKNIKTPLISIILDNNNNNIQTGGGLISDLVEKFSTNLNALFTVGQNIEEDKNKYNLKKEEYEKRKNEIIKLTTRTNNDQAELTKLNTKIADLDKKIINFKTEAKNINKIVDNVNKNLNNYTNKNVFDLQQNATQFMKDTKNIKSSAELYDSFVNKVTKDDYLLYNELWNTYLHNPSLLKNSSNIHLVVSDKLVENVQQLQNILEDKTLDKQAILDLKNKFTLMSNLYEKVFVKMICDYKELPKIYDRNENYMLYDVVNNIIHTVNSVITNNFYLAINKTLTKYIATVKFSNNLDVNKNNAVILDVVTKVSTTYTDYVTKDMTRLIVKQLLNLYTDAYDPDSKSESLDKIFDRITQFIVKNYTIDIKIESSLIKNLKEYIYPYYKYLYEQFVKKMELIIDNYNKYIMNECKYIKMIKILLDNLDKTDPNYKSTCANK